MHRYSSFAIATLPLFQNPENVIISIFTFTLSLEKCYIFKSIKWIFKNFLLAERWGRWLLWLKISSAQTFCFCNSVVTTFPTSRKCKNLIFPFRLSGQKCCIFKSISRIFKNFLLAETWGRWLLWLKISSVPIFWFFNRNVTTFPTSRKCNNFNFSLYTVPAEMLYLQKYLTNFQKLSFSWKMRKVAMVVENFKCTDILVLQ